MSEWIKCTTRQPELKDTFQWASKEFNVAYRTAPGKELTDMLSAMSKISDLFY